MRLVNVESKVVSCWSCEVAEGGIDESDRRAFTIARADLKAIPILI